MLKIILLLSIVIGINQTIKVHLHQGVYAIQYSSVKINNLQNLKVNIEKNTITIQGGCNTLTATYKITQGYISFGPWTSTQKYCNEDDDSTIVSQFQKAVKISAYAGKAYLYDMNEGKILKLKKIQ